MKSYRKTEFEVSGGIQRVWAAKDGEWFIEWENKPEVKKAMEDLATVQTHYGIFLTLDSCNFEQWIESLKKMRDDPEVKRVVALAIRFKDNSGFDIDPEGFEKLIMEMSKPIGGEK